MFYPFVITEQKPIKDMQKIKESEHNITDNYHTPKKKATEEERNKAITKQLTKLLLKNSTPPFSSCLAFEANWKGEKVL